MALRFDGRRPDELRPVKITPHFLSHPAGSCLIEMGGTRVICSAMLEESVPPFLKGSGKGWLTAEYSMLPASSAQRVVRERAKVGGRTHEIQRLIGRALRAVVDLKALGERSLLVDCDVLDADGGTRTAAITGSYIAVVLALRSFASTLPALSDAVQCGIAAVSVGMIDGEPCLDLPYEEDKKADVDMNIVKTSLDQYVELQGTAEGAAFGREMLDRLLALGDKGVRELLAIQKKVLDG